MNKGRSVTVAGRPVELTATEFDLLAHLARQPGRVFTRSHPWLRTPLAVLQSGIEAQVDGIHPRDDRDLASLLEETQLLGRLIDDLHTLALADAGRLTLHHEPVSAEALVDGAVASLTALAGRKEIVLTADVVPPVDEMEADPTRVRRSWPTCCPTPSATRRAGGRGRVSAVGVGDAVRFTVADSGPGFPADRLPHLFERNAPSADSRGSGLGLAIAADLVRAHGGVIRAENAAAGGAGW